MTTELQNKAWSVLPKEFKEEVKKMYKVAQSYAMGDLEINARVCESVLLELFGLHNLTSDAEGEEMLTVSRKRVQEVCAKNIAASNSDGHNSYDYGYYEGVINILSTLFGSKCLPDASNVASTDPKPAEPKFKVGDKVRYRCDGKIHEVKAKTGKYHYALSGLGHDVHEEYLEPYTEPKETKAEEMADKAIKPVAEHFDNILKNSIAKERRLTIAARMMQGLICAPLVPGVDPNSPAEYLAQTAFRLADALIAEAEK